MSQDQIGLNYLTNGNREISHHGPISGIGCLLQGSLIIWSLKCSSKYRTKHLCYTWDRIQWQIFKKNKKNLNYSSYIINQGLYSRNKINWFYNQIKLLKCLKWNIFWTADSTDFSLTNILPCCKVVNLNTYSPICYLH